MSNTTTNARREAVRRAQSKLPPYALEVLGTQEAIVYNAETFERVSPILEDVSMANLYLGTLNIATEAGLNATQVRAAWDTFMRLDGAQAAAFTGSARGPYATAFTGLEA